jgi:predicted nucleic acid-binding protein
LTGSVSRDVTVDSSVVIPALASWHEAHGVARAACHGVTQVPAHVMLESISVLTRLPRGLALDGKSATAVVRGKFPTEPLVLSPAQHVALTDAIAAAGLRGGQLYDALVAATAAAHGVRLISLDTRAAPTYRAIGVEYELLLR